MRAVVLTSPGTPLELLEVPDPVVDPAGGPRSQEVLNKFRVAIADKADATAAVSSRSSLRSCSGGSDDAIAARQHAREAPPS
jgi:hypothetical protein